MGFQGNLGDYLEAISDLLKENSTISLDSIKDTLSLPEEAISSAINFLCEKSLITRDGDKSISLTESGKEAIENITMLKDYILNFVDKDDNKDDSNSISDMLSMENFAKIKNFIDDNDKN